MALPPSEIDGKPWYDAVDDRWLARVRRLPSSVTVVVGLGVVWLGFWLAFGAPLFFESPHPVLFCAPKGGCYDFPSSQYELAKTALTAVFLSASAFMFIAAYVAYRRWTTPVYNALPPPPPYRVLK